MTEEQATELLILLERIAAAVELVSKCVALESDDCGTMYVEVCQ